MSSATLAFPFQVPPSGSCNRFNRCGRYPHCLSGSPRPFCDHLLFCSTDLSPLAPLLRLTLIRQVAFYHHGARLLRGLRDLLLSTLPSGDPRGWIACRQQVDEMAYGLHDVPVVESTPDWWRFDFGGWGFVVMPFAPYSSTKLAKCAVRALNMF